MQTTTAVTVQGGSIAESQPSSQAHLHRIISMRIKAINNTLAIYPPLISLSIVLIIIITFAATLKGNGRFQQVHHTTYHITCRGAASERVREEPSYYKQTVHSSSQVGVSR